PREETIDEDFETEGDIIVSKRQRILVAFAVHSTGLPTTIQQAHSSPEREEWIKATNAEYDSLMEHETWSLCELPPGRKPIGCRWLFTKKYSADGSLLRYKARLVAQGFTQVAGIDYTDIFAPVIRTSSIRFLLALAALQSMQICHMDVQTAFLNGNLQETLYMRQPPGYVQPGQDHLVCRLNKSIYGLKQSSREWNSALDSYFKSKGFVQLKTDPCIYFQSTRQGLVLVGVYVDDFILLSTSTYVLETTKRNLSSRFHMKDLGNLTFCLGIEVERLQDGSIFPHQRKYIGRTSVPDYDNSSRHSLYKHQQIAKRVLRYLKGTQDYGLLYSKSDKEDFTIDLYVDADYANDTSTRRSTSGFLLFLNGCLISWKSKLQIIVALSTCEAEYISMSYGLQEALWLKSLLEELQLVIKLPINVYEDNQSTIKMAENPTLQQRTKHIDVRHHFIRDLVKQRIIKINYCQTNSMLADILTKALPKPKFEEHMPKLVTSIPPNNNKERSRLEGSVEERVASVRQIFDPPNQMFGAHIRHLI
ncbi:hypothetical protein LEN26_019217, partial [Aphanomyces euteiches]